MVTIKIGGRAAVEQESLHALLKEIQELRVHYQFVLVHGGGAEVSKVTEIFGLQPVFKDGVRMTSPDEMDIVDMVLAGKMNKYLVRMCNLYLPAVGLSGSDGKLFTGTCIACGENEITCTGEIQSVDPGILHILLENGYTPVISSTSMDRKGQALNINADEAALAVAAALPSSRLLFLSDVPGILKGNQVLPILTKDETEEEIARGVVFGGMIPKVRSSVKALEQGVGAIVIGRHAAPGDLSGLIEGTKGSRIVLEHPVR